MSLNAERYSYPEHRFIARRIKGGCSHPHNTGDLIWNFSQNYLLACTYNAVHVYKGKVRECLQLRVYANPRTDTVIANLWVIPPDHTEYAVGGFQGGGKGLTYPRAIRSAVYNAGFEVNTPLEFREVIDSCDWSGSTSVSNGLAAICKAAGVRGEVSVISNHSR